MIRLTVAGVLITFVAGAHGQQFPTQSAQPRLKTALKSLSWEDVSLDFNGQVQTKYDHVLDLGPVPVTTETPTPSMPNSGCWPEAPQVPRPTAVERSFDVKISTNAAEEHTLTLVHAGSKVTAAWVDHQGPSAVLAAKGSRVLRITFYPDEGTTQDLNIVSIIENRKAVINIALDYSFLKAEIAVQFGSGQAMSGPSDAFSPPYTLATGPAPFMYTVARACYWVTGDRSECNSNKWSTCALVRHDDADVVFEFTLQGHKENSSAAMSEGHLYAEYYLKTSQAKLR